MNNCLHCSSETHNSKFCSSSCAASYNNKNRVRTDESKLKTSAKLKSLGIKPPSGMNLGKRWAKSPDQNWQSYCKKTGFYLNASTLPLVKGYELYVTYGMYHHIHNPGGVVKDHRLSKKEGYLQGVDFKKMKHPANCEFLLHSDNNKKSKRSSITVEELELLIEKWRP